MATTLPVPIEFRLPEGWRPLPPDQAGAPGAAFVAVHPQPDAGFTTNLTIDGEYRPDATPLSEFADQSVRHLGTMAEAVKVAARQDLGTEEAPGLTQTLTFSTAVGDERRDLVQSQVYLSMLDADDPHRRAVIRLVLTTTAAQFEDVLPDFQSFVGTVRPETGPAS